MNKKKPAPDSDLENIDPDSWRHDSENEEDHEDDSESEEKNEEDHESEENKESLGKTNKEKKYFSRKIPKYVSDPLITLLKSNINRFQHKNSTGMMALIHVIDEYFELKIKFPGENERKELEKRDDDSGK